MEFPRKMALPCRIMEGNAPGKLTFILERIPGVHLQGEALLKDFWGTNGAPASAAADCGLGQGFVAVAAHHSETDEIPVVLPNRQRMVVNRARLLDCPPVITSPPIRPSAPSLGGTRGSSSSSPPRRRR